MSDCVIWAERFEDMKLFYSELLGVEVGDTALESVKISNGIHTVHLHRVPTNYLGDLPAVAPVRSDMPLKPVFDLHQDLIAQYVQRYVVIKTFTFEDAVYYDITDPDGNVICVYMQGSS